MIEVIETTDRAKLDHDLIVPITKGHVQRQSGVLDYSSFYGRLGFDWTS